MLDTSTGKIVTHMTLLEPKVTLSGCNPAHKVLLCLGLFYHCLCLAATAVHVCLSARRHVSSILQIQFIWVQFPPE